MEIDRRWMWRALDLAKKAQAYDEVPVGAVLVSADGRLLGEGWNQPIGNNDPTAPAEIQAIRAAATAVGNYRLVDTTLYVTLEPCPMCAGALVHSRVRRVVIAAADPRTGAGGSVFELLSSPYLNHRIETDIGLLADESSELLKGFFAARRVSQTNKSEGS